MSKIKYILLIIFSFFIKNDIQAQYYNSAFGLNGTALKTALHQIIKNHNAHTYNDLWTDFQQSDKKQNGTVWDIYTDKPNGSPTYIFQFISDQCGNYSAEGDCYNREHLWPKEKFNDGAPMITDLHHIFPTDGWVNNKHAAYPMGNVSNATYTSTNGTKLGNGAGYAAYNDKIFEPIDSFKGDVARAYFYMSTRYENEDAGWDNWAMANGAELTQDAINILLTWHHNDPVSQKEIDRNNAVATLQFNRNPFIDYPEFADCIWGTGDCISLDIKENITENELNIFPNPTSQILHIEMKTVSQILNIYVIDFTGKIVLQKENNQTEKTCMLDTKNLSEGNYLLLVNTSKGNARKIFSKK